MTRDSNVVVLVISPLKTTIEIRIILIIEIEIEALIGRVPAIVLSTKEYVLLQIGEAKISASTQRQAHLSALS